MTTASQKVWLALYLSSRIGVDQGNGIEAAVPAQSDAEIGGPMNAQAEALAALTKLLRIEVVEALRRSYACVCAKAGSASIVKF